VNRRSPRNDVAKTLDLGSVRVVGKRVDANTTSWEVKKTGGKHHATGQNVISKDGKTLTQTAKGTGAEGKPEESTNVFDKQ